ncbi:MAG: hypothetical protein Q8P59_11640, partial [Dehalococcoidia bacterium]|nr:hypothetical protein [Dehalococcoidia bacterium]
MRSLDMVVRVPRYITPNEVRYTMEISEQLWILMGLAFTVAVVHSLSPDHWLPFVLLGRAKNWKIMHTLGIAGAAGTAHVGSSIIIGLIGVGLGEVLIEEFASTIDIVSGSALILFGVGFAYLSWRAKGHHRHGIPFLTRRLGVDMEETEKYMHVHGDEQEHSHDQGDEH